MKTLVLFMPFFKNEDFKNEIYIEYLNQMQEWVPGSICHTYSSDDALVEVIEKNNISVVISTNNVYRRTALLLRGMMVVQIILGLSDSLADVVDITIDPFSSDKNFRGNYFGGADYLLPSVLDKIPVEKILPLYGVQSEEIQEVIATNDAEKKIKDICCLFTMLNWDSAFFGFNIAYISCRRLTQNIERLVRVYTRDKNFKLIEYLCNCHDRTSVQIAENSGYSFVDIRLTFALSTDIVLKDVPEIDGYSIRKGKESDINKLMEIAHDIYKDSRYYYDGNFEKSKVIEFYTEWVKKAIYGTFDDYAYIACDDNDNPIGFCTVKENKKRFANIGLFGIDKTTRGTGLGLYLLKSTLWHLKQTGYAYVEVVTQGRNYDAQRLYQKCGFLTKKTELWYHKWL